MSDFETHPIGTEKELARLRAALERIVNLDYTRAGTNCCAYDAHKISKKALANRAEPDPHPMLETTEKPASYKGLSEADSGGLCFGCVEDGRDFAAQSLQDSVHWLSAHDINFAESYVEGNAQVVCRVRVMCDLTQYDLVFNRVPNGWKAHGYETTGAVEVLDHATTSALTNGYDDAVLSTVGNLIEHPKQVIPSAIRIERPKERRDLRWEVFASPTYDTVKVRFSMGKGEISVLEPRISTGLGTGEASLIKDGSEVSGDMCGSSAQFLREFLGKLEFMSIESGFRIILNDKGVWFWIEESTDLPFEFVDIFICSNKQ